MRNKSQLKIQQMAFMLMAVFLFFILVGMFYIVFYMTDLKKRATILEKDNAVEMANMLAGSAEFSCGDYCIDADRMMVLRNRTLYKTFWRLASIEIRTVYPNSTKEIACTESNYPKCNLIKIYEKEGAKSTASSFVSVCKRISEKDYVYYKCEIGKIIVGYNVFT
jgi:hypothetical protein